MRTTLRGRRNDLRRQLTAAEQRGLPQALEAMLGTPAHPKGFAEPLKKSDAAAKAEPTNGAGDSPTNKGAA